MTIKHQFRYFSEDDSECQQFVTIDQWVATLPAEQQARFRIADARQKKFRQKAIDAGFMKMDADGNYVWDEEYIKNRPENEYKPYDPVWLEFFNRYLDQNKLKFQIEQIKE